MKNMFVYGTLIFDDTWNRIVQHHYEKQAAMLPGYKRLSVKGECYPGLVKTFNGSVEGVIYFGAGLISNSPWDPARFQAYHLDKYIARFNGF